jgi:hypothetical protein
MTGEGNGRLRRYRVSMSGMVGQQIKDAARRAAEAGLLEQFVDALLTVNNRLRTDPHGFGEKTVDLYALKLVAHTGSVAPLTVQFAIDDENLVVHIGTIILRSI